MKQMRLNIIEEFLNIGGGGQTQTQRRGVRSLLEDTVLPLPHLRPFLIGLQTFGCDKRGHILEGARYSWVLPLS